MMRKITYFIILLILPVLATAQMNTWDVALTEILISHNKKNYADNKKAKNNQLLSEATVLEWRKITTKFKQITDSINKRLIAVYIVTSDAQVAYEIYKAIGDIYNYQKKSINIANKYPFTLPIIINREKLIYKKAKDLALFTAMVVLSPGEISKMKTSDRKLIYSDVRDKINKLSFQCFSMYVKMQQIEAMEQMKRQPPINWINKDKELSQKILKNFKF